MDSDDIDSGIYTAAPEASEPTWFATGDERTLNDLMWTPEALRGTTPNSHRIATISLTDGDRLETEPGRRDTGAFWSSPDGRVTVSGPGSFGTGLRITTIDGAYRLVASTDARSVALSGDRRTIIAADWFDGTRLIDVETGRSHRVLNGSQLFVAVSEHDDVAWATEEQYGHSRLCTSTIDRLD
jgi:hypothetical protein